MGSIRISSQSLQRFVHHIEWHFWIPLFVGAYMIFYLAWRATETINPQVLFLSWLLWGAEAFSVVNYLLFSWMTRRVDPPVPYRPPRPGLKVDVFIPTYNEDVEILEATLTGCRLITYPHRTYLLDDGRREEVRQLAERFGVGYITRPDNHHAKAGNLNHALKHTDGDFIVVLDADMVPQPDFLERTLGYFEDERLAFVQLPQEFYNLDSVQHDQSKPTWHEQSLFFHVIQPGKNYTNSAFWCGSPSIIRRKALEDVGGVATETITEDIHTSVRLHSRGWKSLFVNESLAFGIAPQTITAYLLQRLRWAQGTMQLYRSKESPLWIPGLTLKQRLSYLASFLAYIESVQKFIFLMMPVVILLFNVLPMRVELPRFLLFWTPYFILNIVANQLGGRGYFRYFKSEIYAFLRMVVFIQSLLVLLVNKPLKFQVTPKSVDRSVYEKERSALRLHFALLGTMIGALLFGSFRLLFSGITSLSHEAFWIVLFWGAYNAVVVYLGVREVLSRRHERRHYRFPANLQGYLEYCGHKYPAQIYNLSLSGVGLRVQAPFAPNVALENGARLTFSTPYHPCLHVALKLVRFRRADAQGWLDGGAAFDALEPMERDHLLEYLFVYRPGELLRKGTIALQSVTTPSFQPQSLTASSQESF
ncbi:MAG: glycosyltransferase [Thermanaerothrix sp.]|nr:glycosyltransferase [Thermanaerothrix sp.]